MKDYIIKIDSQYVINILGSSQDSSKRYEKTLEKITDNMATNSELVSAAAVSGIRYGERVQGGAIASDKSLDQVLERLAKSQQRVFTQCMNDFEYMHAAVYTENLIRFCFSFTETMFEKEYTFCRLRYVEKWKSDMLRERFGGRRSTMLRMISDEIYLTMMLYAIARCSETPMQTWNERFGTSKLKDIITQPELLTNEEKLYVNIMELRAYAEKRRNEQI